MSHERDAVDTYDYKTELMREITTLRATLARVEESGSALADYLEHHALSCEGVGSGAEMLLREWLEAKLPVGTGVREGQRPLVQAGDSAQDGPTAHLITRLTAERDGLREDNQRLRDILVADGLDPDMPIPPGLKLERDRFLEQRDGLRAALERAKYLVEDYNDNLAIAICSLVDAALGRS